MKPVSLLDVQSYLPPNRVHMDFYLEAADPRASLKDNPMFSPPPFRHHASREETSADMIERAARPLLDRLGPEEAGRIDVLLTNVLLPTLPHTGAAAEAAHRLGVNPSWVIDVHNGGCASFILMLKLARLILSTTEARTALLCNVQNCAGPVFGHPQLRAQPPSAVPGDGCGVAYLATSARSPILAVATRSYPEFAADMSLALPDGRKYWEPGTSPLNVQFTEAKVAKIIARGNRLVPELVGEVCQEIGRPTREVDLLITNQPNRMFLRNWREALELPAERHADTFDLYGNLFGAGVPITLSHALQNQRVPDGALLVLAGFAHAGDFAGAAAVHWRGGDN